jgi:nicotinamidase-related amidase
MTGSQGRGADRWPITVKNMAVIVVDMQNIWVDPRGVRYLQMSENIVPRIQELLRFCRSNQVPVVYLHIHQAQRSGGRRYLRRHQAADP